MGGRQLLFGKILRQSDTDGDRQQARETGKLDPLHHYVLWKVRASSRFCTNALC